MSASLNARLERLERENRRMRLGGGACLLLAGAATVMSLAGPQKVPDEITARKFSVVDEQGRQRATLIDKGLCLFDTNGEPRVLLAGDGSTYFLSLARGLSDIAAFLRVDKTGLPALSLNDQDGQERVKLHLGPDGPALHIKDPRTESLASLSVQNERPRLILGEKGTAGVGLMPDVMLFFGADNETLWSAPPTWPGEQR